MRTTTFTKTVGLITLAASVHAAIEAIQLPTQELKNYCKEPVYLTFTNGTGSTAGPFPLTPNQAFSSKITGNGNSIGITKNQDYWSPSTPKMIFGTSADEKSGILYWTISSVDGDPMIGEVFSVTSNGTVPNVCGGATNYDGQVHACADNGVALTVTLC